MGPYIFYRVEDGDSRARYYHDEGIFAEDVDEEVDFGTRGWRLLCQVERHLDWGNRVPTPFISMYCNKIVAFREAERRVRDGKEDVRVYTIDMRERDERVEYRNIWLLTEKLGFDIPERAWNNSEYEYVVLHHIPDSAVVDCFDL